MKIRRIFSFALVLAMVATASFASAAIYFERKAGMRLFSGRIETIGSSITPDSPHLVLSIGDRNAGVTVGTEGDITTEDANFPILVDATADYDTYSWHDSNGKEALKAPIFTLSTEGGAVLDPRMRIEVTGDSSAFAALRYGAYVVRYTAEGNFYREDTKILDINPNGVSGEIEIGDMLEGERVEIIISTWVTSYDLERTGFESGEFQAEAVFSYAEN